MFCMLYLVCNIGYKYFSCTLGINLLKCFKEHIFHSQIVSMSEIPGELNHTEATMAMLRLQLWKAEK